MRKSRRERFALRVGARLLEAPAFMLDTMHIPLIRQRQNKLIADLYRSSNLMRKMAGEKPKRFKRILEGNRIVEVE